MCVAELLTDCLAVTLTVTAMPSHTPAVMAVLAAQLLPSMKQTRQQVQDP